MRRIVRALVFILGAAFFSNDAAAETLTMPQGNRNAQQPAVPGASVRRTQAGSSTFDTKYRKVRELLATDRELMGKIRTTARAYGIDPLHMIGAIVGEHTFNVDAYDRLQSYYVKAAAYAGNSFRFAYDGESVADFTARPQFSQCNAITGSYRLWKCREDVWDSTFRGRKVGGTSYPDNRFSAVFFQPFYAGQTFGIGQVNPLTALMMSDMVSRTSGYEKLDENNAAAIYRSIMDPDRSLAFMAAIIRRSIDDYKSIAGIDISGNPGITATLYNVGGSASRAAVLAASNRQRAANGEAPLLPEENYYGWYVNDKLEDLTSLL